jgi:tetratricopeptide (TPR) repeat protein
LSQLILVPIAAVGAFYLLPRHTGRPTLGDLQNFVQYLAIAGFVALLLAPNIAYYFGMGISNLLDPHDWTPFEEEIALRPIQKLIDKDNYHDALTELDQLLNKHKPTYEALLLKTKLLHHFSSVDETVKTLLEMIPLSHSIPQQLAVMEALSALESQFQSPANIIVPGMRRIHIRHELVLFPVDANDLTSYKAIPPGEYEVEETIHGTSRWLKLASENWGNSEICWEALRETRPATSSQPKRDVFAPITRMHQTITNAIVGRRHFEAQAQAKALLKEAGQFIRQEGWQRALPLLQKASICDPHSYEIAYRLVQVARHIGNQENSARTLREVLSQNHWSDDEQSMLLQG